MRLVTKALCTAHHFTLPYCPWSNETVELLGREVLCVARALLSKLQLRPDQCPDLIPVFQPVLSQFPSPQRNNTAPVTAFTGLPPTLPIATFMNSDTARPVTLFEVIQHRIINMKALQERIETLHPVVESSLQANCARARAAAERDYGLVAREDFHSGKTIMLTLAGATPRHDNDQRLCLLSGRPQKWKPLRSTRGPPQVLFRLVDRRQSSTAPRPTIRDLHACSALDPLD